MSDSPFDLRWRSCVGSLAVSLVERDADGLALVDPATGNWLAVNERMAQWCGQSAGELSGPRPAERFGEAGPSLRAAEQAAALQDGPVTTEHKLALAGVRREFSILRQRVTGPEGQMLVAEAWRDLAPQRRREAQLANALQQLEQQQLANEQLRKEAQGTAPRDSASGLYNRAHFEDQLRREVDLSTREHREFALVAIEIDPIEDTAAVRARVHDTLGRLLRGNTRAMDASCRDSDDRFAVLLSGVGLATAHSRMEGLRRQCATQIVAHEGRDIGFTVSMGVASFPHTAQGQDELREACEAALADARRRGGNRVTLASIRFDAA
jgi:diguanylate cyclase (GGDEF)-like protein